MAKEASREHYVMSIAQPISIARFSYDDGTTEKMLIDGKWEDAARPRLVPGQHPLAFTGPFDQPRGEAIDDSLVQSLCASARARVIRLVRKLTRHRSQPGDQ